MKEVPIPRSQDVRKLSVAHDNPAPVSEEEKIRIQLKQEEAERLAYERELQLKREDAKRFREMEVASVTRQGVEDYGTAKVVVNQPTEELSKPSVPVVIVTASANSKASELSHPQATPKKGLPRRPPGDTNFYRVIPEEQSYGSRRVSADRHEMLERRGVGRGRYESFDRRFPDDMREGTGRRFPSIDREGTGRRFPSIEREGTGRRFPSIDREGTGKRFPSTEREGTERKYSNADREGTGRHFPSIDGEGTKKRLPSEGRETSERRYSNQRESDRFRRWSTDRTSRNDRTDRPSRTVYDCHDNSNHNSRTVADLSDHNSHSPPRQPKWPQREDSGFILEGSDYDKYIENQLKWKSIPVTQEYHILDNGELDVGVDLDAPVDITPAPVEEESGR